jgi:hypothetical protein
MRGLITKNGGRNDAERYLPKHKVSVLLPLSIIDNAATSSISWRHPGDGDDPDRACQSSRPAMRARAQAAAANSTS